MILIIVEPEFVEDLELNNIVTPIKIENLVSLLPETNYNESEIKYLEQGFKQGFDIGYKGPDTRQSNSKNIPLRVGYETELWNKLIKEVRLSRVAGPFDHIPYENYIQSPIGLVPKAGNKNKTWLIFHLSYDFGQQEDQWSLNFHMPNKICTVKYRDLDHVVKTCVDMQLEAKQKLANKKQGTIAFQEEVIDDSIHLEKTDVESAFHLIPLSIMSCQ